MGDLMVHIIDDARIAKQKHEQETVEKIVELAKQGFTGRMIAKELGITANAVYGLSWRNEICLSEINPNLKERKLKRPMTVSSEASKKAAPGEPAHVAHKDTRTEAAMGVYTLYYQ